MNKEEAINLIQDIEEDGRNVSAEHIEALNLAIKALEDRPTGEWIFLKANEEQTDGYECSVCKATYHTKVPYFSEFNYCPHCGARMEA